MVSSGSNEGLAILLIEDSVADARLITRALEQHGLAPDVERVETPAELRDALTRRRWELLITDSALPQLGVLGVIALASELAPEVPVIVVSGATSAASADAAIRAGAVDCVDKHDLPRLGPVAVRALNQVRAPTAPHRMLAAQEATRRRIARALHDDLGQLLLTLRQSLISLSERVSVDDAVALVDDITQRVRDVTVELWPTILDDLGLPAALRWLSERQSKTGLTILVDADAVDRLPIAVETAGFRIAQEALTNTLRHAGASRVTIGLRVRGPVVELTITDDGAGFDPGPAWQHAATGGSLGLLSMREAAVLAGGTLQIHSTPGSGTAVRVRLPRAGEPGP